jgi:DNA-binding transcriptional LysR family regulator
MDEAQLKAFITVNRYGSFSDAAEQLHLTQPAVSKRIATLESQLGCRLFDRIGHRTLLTEAGRQLLPLAEQMLAEFNDLRNRVDHLHATVSGKLNLGTSHHIGLHRLPPILRHFTQTYPEVELALYFVDSEDGCRGVESAELEMAIVTLPPQPAATLQVSNIWEDPLSVVVGRDHPLASRGRISIDDLLQHDAIMPGSNTFTRTLLEQQLGLGGQRLRVCLETNYLETNKMMANIGLGWTVLPETMVDNDLRRITLDGITLHRTLGCVTHRGRTLSNASRAMISLLEQYG